MRGFPGREWLRPVGGKLCTQRGRGCGWQGALKLGSLETGTGLDGTGGRRIRLLAEQGETKLFSIKYNFGTKAERETGLQVPGT